MRASAEFAIYTPGSGAGLTLSILKSFAAPSPAIREHTELLQQQIGTTVGSLLGLVGISADPIRSREHILLSTILERAWRAGQDLDLTGVIHQVQSPPFSRVGVMEVESFYPSKERFSLSTALNSLVASPSFGAWLHGDPLDVDALLHTPDGRPRISIISIAHLNDAERMFFVALLLNQVVGWMRKQSGTTSLRTILYMDELYGYLPPVANPPAKGPLLTLLNQARPVGVGVVYGKQKTVCMG
jgi:hypothetical protein